MRRETTSQQITIKKDHRREKILLALLPFWDPQIPPLGLASLKSFVKRHNFNVKIVDINTKDQFRQVIKTYFETLKEFIPGDKRGNYFKITHDVFQNHLMAHMNYKDRDRYLELVKLLIYKTFYTHVNTRQVLALGEIASDFFTRLKKYFLNLLEIEKPTILGLSVFNGTLPASLFAFKLTKENYPDIKTVMGGGIFADQLNTRSPEFNNFLDQTPYIDKIIVGEGENLFLKYLSDELPRSQRVYQLEDNHCQTVDISSLEVPDFSDLDLQLYPYLSAFTSRSCPFECSFCSETMMWGKYRKKSAKQVVQELKEMHRRYRTQLFMFGDSLLNPIINDLAEELLKADLSFYWDGYLRIDRSVCDVKNTLQWRKGGFYRARLGVESGSPHVLELMEKRITPTQIKKALTNLAYAGIKTTTYWVVGHPGEKETDFQETLKLIEEMKDDIYEADCTPFQYFLSGQSYSNDWQKKNKAVLLYPEEARDMLMIQTWIMDCEPSRQETYKRMNRFVRHCNELGVPNPYSLHEVYNADERWKKLHKNAVPSLLEFSKTFNIKENREDKRLLRAQNKQLDKMVFEF